MQCGTIMTIINHTVACEWQSSTLNVFKCVVSSEAVLRNGPCQMQTEHCTVVNGKSANHSPARTFMSLKWQKRANNPKPFHLRPYVSLYLSLFVYVMNPCGPVALSSRQTSPQYTISLCAAFNQPLSFMQARQGRYWHQSEPVGP